MVSSYPGAIDDLNTVSNPTLTHAEVAEALTAVQETLGTDPQGGESTVGERLDSLAATASRDTAVHVTGSLGSGASETSTVTLAPSWRIWRVETTAPARVRLYTDTASRDTDLSRSTGTDPDQGSGLLLEVLDGDDPLDLLLSPLVDGVNSTYSPATAITVTRLSGSGTVTVTLHFLSQEA